MKIRTSQQKHPQLERAFKAVKTYLELWRRVHFPDRRDEEMGGGSIGSIRPGDALQFESHIKKRVAAYIT